jgi:hypothetical protein
MLKTVIASTTLCFFLESEDPAKYLSSQIRINGYLHKDKRLNAEIAYSIGIAAAAVDSLCTENRGGFMDFVDSLKKP